MEQSSEEGKRTSTFIPSILLSANPFVYPLPNGGCHIYNSFYNLWTFILLFLLLRVCAHTRKPGGRRKITRKFLVPFSFWGFVSFYRKRQDINIKHELFIFWHCETKTRMKESSKKKLVFFPLLRSRSPMSSNAFVVLYFPLGEETNRPSKRHTV